MPVCCPSISQLSNKKLISGRAVTFSGISSLAPGDKFFNTPYQDASLQEDTVLAFPAADADVRSQAHHLPLAAAAGVAFFETDDVAQFDFGNHFR